MASCPVFQAAGIVGKKWTPVILQEVSLHGEKGFNFVLRRMGRVTPKVLSRRLKELEAQGLLERTVQRRNTAARTVYKLTPKGMELHAIVDLLKEWSRKYCPGSMDCGRRECTRCPLYLS